MTLPYERGALLPDTAADVAKLRAAGYSRPFRDVRSGIKDYLDALGSRP